MARERQESGVTVPAVLMVAAVGWLGWLMSVRDAGSADDRRSSWGLRGISGVPAELRLVTLGVLAEPRLASPAEPRLKTKARENTDKSHTSRFLPYMALQTLKIFVYE